MQINICNEICNHSKECSFLAKIRLKTPPKNLVIVENLFHFWKQRTTPRFFLYQTEYIIKQVYKWESKHRIHSYLFIFMQILPCFYALSSDLTFQPRKTRQTLKCSTKVFWFVFKSGRSKQGGKMVIVENLFYLWKQKLCLRLVWSRGK